MLGSPPGRLLGLEVAPAASEACRRHQAAPRDAPRGRRRGVSCRPGLTPCPFSLLGVLVGSHTLTVGPVGVQGEHPQPLGTGHPALTRDHADNFCFPLFSLHH